MTAAAEGVIREVIVVDGGSSDGTERVADAAGCSWVSRKGLSRSERLAEGARIAKRGDWLLFLRPETLLESGWHHEAQAFIERASRARQEARTAASFRLRYESFGMAEIKQHPDEAFDAERIEAMIAAIKRRADDLGLEANQAELVWRTLIDWNVAWEKSAIAARLELGSAKSSETVD